MEKKRKYNARILQVEKGSFTPLGFPINGGVGKDANTCYSRIAEKLAKKQNEPYSMMMSWIRTKIFLSIMN